MSAHPKVSCPKCGHEAQQVFEPYGINFKGSGFYNTDQRDKK
jgi:predicted nucleic acid-binding Zn ribbon protein